MPSTSPTAPESTPSAVRDGASHLRFWLVAVAFLALDLWSKHWAFSSLTDADTYTVLPSVLVFQRSLNDGAVFGSFTGYVGVFAAASVLALLFVLFLFMRSRRNQWVFHVALGLILAGALGNLYDRAVIKATIVTYEQGGTTIHLDDEDPTTATPAVPYEGAWTARGKVIRVHEQGVVRDFIRFLPRIPEWVPKYGGRDVWPWVFNVADASLVCGVIALLLLSLFERKAVTRAPGEEDDDVPADREAVPASPAPPAS